MRLGVVIDDMVLQGGFLVDEYMISPLFVLSFLVQGRQGTRTHGLLLSGALSDRLRLFELCTITSGGECSLCSSKMSLQGQLGE